MTEQPDMKYTLFRRRKKNGDEIAIGRSVVWLTWIILGFLLILLGRPVAGFHWP